MLKPQEKIFGNLPNDILFIIAGFLTNKDLYSFMLLAKEYSGLLQKKENDWFWQQKLKDDLKIVIKKNKHRKGYFRELYKNTRRREKIIREKIEEIGKTIVWKNGYYISDLYIADEVIPEIVKMPLLPVHRNEIFRSILTNQEILHYLRNISCFSCILNSLRKHGYSELAKKLVNTLIVEKLTKECSIKGLGFKKNSGGDFADLIKELRIVERYDLIEKLVNRYFFRQDRPYHDSISCLIVNDIEFIEKELSEAELNQLAEKFKNYYFIDENTILDNLIWRVQHAWNLRYFKLARGMVNKYFNINESGEREKLVVAIEKVSKSNCNECIMQLINGKLTKKLESLKPCNDKPNKKRKKRKTKKTKNIVKKLKKTPSPEALSTRKAKPKIKQKKQSPRALLILGYLWKGFCRDIAFPLLHSLTGVYFVHAAKITYDKNYKENFNNTTLFSHVIRKNSNPDENRKQHEEQTSDENNKEKQIIISIS
ncbi:MAG: hypothetical protein PVI75_09000 [Gammaproteobacteria bacterium]|jgi:hypothetical protein